MDELKEWARDAPPAWAVITGAISDLVIIDFDGETGLRTMQHLGLQPHIRTGSGGAHWYVQHPGQHVPTLSSKTKIELGREFPGLDVRGDGGYAVFYGRNLCGEYEKLRDLQPDPFTHIPSALRAALLPAQAAPPPQLVGELFPAPERVGDNILLDRALAQIGTHGRNSAGFWLAQQLRDNGYPESEAEYVLRMFAAMTPPTNSKGQREPYTTREALASLRQAYARPARDPWRRTCRPAVYRPTMAPCAAPDPTDDEVDAEPSAHAGDEQPQIRHNGAKKSNAPVESQATKLLNMTQDIELFTAPGAKPYATVMVDCHAETYPVRSAAFRMYLQHRYYKQAGTALNANALNEAIGVYTARANYEGPEQEVSIRVGHAGGKVYLDLGTRDWDAIEIDADGWRHVRQPPIKFKRSQGSLSLPYPARCPNALDLLAGMLNLVCRL